MVAKGMIPHIGRMSGSGKVAEAWMCGTTILPWTLDEPHRRAFGFFDLSIESFGTSVTTTIAEISI